MCKGFKDCLDEMVKCYTNYSYENSFGTFVKISSTQLERNDPLSNVMTRQNSNFDKIILYEMKRAIKVFDSSMIQGDISESFSYEFPERISKLYDPEIQARMSLENQRAELILSQMSDY